MPLIVAETALLRPAVTLAVSVAAGAAVALVGNARLRRALAQRTLELEAQAVALERETADRVHAELALRESEATLRGFFNANETLLGVLELDGDDVRFALPNRRLASFFGFKVPEMIGRTGRELGVPEDVRRTWAQQMRRSLHDGAPATFEQPLPWNGVVHWYASSISPIHEVATTVPRFGFAAVDVTPRRAAQQALRDSEERLRLAQQAARIGTWDRDLETGETTWSEEQGQLFGVAGGKRSYEEFLALVHPEDREVIVRASVAAIEQRSRFHAEFRAVLPDGTVRWLSGTGRVLCDEAGVPVRMLGLNVDVTEHKEALAALKSSEAQLLQAQKMESVGRLAGGVAHDFNNLLTAILAYTDLARRCTPADAPTGIHLENIRQAAGRAADLTRQLLAFARKQIIEPRPIDLAALVQGVEVMLRRLIGEDVELCTTAADERWYATVDPGQMEQILINLAVNARDAMPNGGRLTIATGNVTPDEAFRRAHPGLAPGDHVVVSVTDTGVGMDPEVQAHLFEPFFTTKPLGQGTGLGLATCYGIVKQNGGHIDVETAAGIGSTFRVYLPRATGVPDPEREPTMPSDLQTGSETILLVEDEPLVRDVTRSLLDMLGYRVLMASDGAEALRVAGDHRDVIDLVLTDLVMPQMGGRELAEQLRLVCPRARVLFTSGYTEDAVFRRELAGQDVAFLQKPFTTGVLARKVREVLDSHLPVA